MSITTSTTNDAPFRERQYVLPDTAEKQCATCPLDLLRLKGKEQILSSIPTSMLALVILLVWQVSTTYGYIDRLLLPTPFAVFSSLIDGLNSGIYLSSTLTTIEESVLGFLLAVVLALPLGYGLVKSRLLAAALQPYLAAGQAVPAIVIAPFLSLFLGYGIFPHMIICALVVFFPMVMNTVLGMQTIDSTLLDAAQVEGAVGWSLLAYIEFPLALPAILTAIRTGFTLSITGALVAEIVGGGDLGLGSLVMLAKSQFNPPFMFATLVVLAVLATLYYGVTWLLVRLAKAVY